VASGVYTRGPLRPKKSLWLRDCPLRRTRCTARRCTRVVMSGRTLGYVLAWEFL